MKGSTMPTRSPTPQTGHDATMSPIPTVRRSPTPPPPKSPTAPPPKSLIPPSPSSVQLDIMTSSNILHLDSQVMVESRKTTRKRKAVDKYTPPIEPKKKITKEKEVKVQLPLDRPNIKYPLPGVPTMQFKATIQYSLEHEVPAAILKKMVNWITDKNTDNEVRENAVQPLSKIFFQELTEPSSWVECNTLNIIFEFMKEKFYR
ncbi:zonadhesin-like isoform X2 [Benincasa hispida]|uniref:zonadhesin-like isoform X2 n=1 Tax=Benincasa hispida TaxID=102211 RepID=UPI0019009DF0|nr:zonadhesin-like isoform X2 [Benincasa hispida]